MFIAEKQLTFFFLYINHTCFRVCYYKHGGNDKIGIGENYVCTLFNILMTSKMI